MTYDYIINKTPNMLILIAIYMIFIDIITGYLKAAKLKKINSSISRDGYIKKIGWIVAIIFGYVLDMLLQINTFLYGTIIILIATEGMSIYENLSEIGVKLPFTKYFEKLKERGKNK